MDVVSTDDQAISFTAPHVPLAPRFFQLLTRRPVMLNKHFGAVRSGKEIWFLPEKDADETDAMR